MLPYIQLLTRLSKLFTKTVGLGVRLVLVPLVVPLLPPFGILLILLLLDPLVPVLAVAAGLLPVWLVPVTLF